MNIEKRKGIALNVFKATYPTITSADLQTFILGMQAMEKIHSDMIVEDMKNEWDLNRLETQTFES